MYLCNTANDQVEKHFVDGKKEITFPDGTIKTVHNDGYQVVTSYNSYAVVYTSVN